MSKFNLNTYSPTHLLTKDPTVATGTSERVQGELAEHIVKIKRCAAVAAAVPVLLSVPLGQRGATVPPGRDRFRGGRALLASRGRNYATGRRGAKIHATPMLIT